MPPPERMVHPPCGARTTRPRWSTILRHPIAIPFPRTTANSHPECHLPLPKDRARRKIRNPCPISPHSFSFSQRLIPPVGVGPLSLCLTAYSYLSKTAPYNSWSADPQQSPLSPAPSPRASPNPVNPNYSHVLSTTTLSPACDSELSDFASAFVDTSDSAIDAVSDPRPGTSPKYSPIPHDARAPRAPRAGAPSLLHGVGTRVALEGG